MDWSDILEDITSEMDNELLPENVLSIITSLGGIEHVIKLCLNHPDSTEIYRQQVLSSLKSIIPKSLSPPLVDSQATVNIDFYAGMESMPDTIAVKSVSVTRLSDTEDIETNREILMTPKLNHTNTNNYKNENNLTLKSKNNLESPNIIVAKNPTQFFRSMVVFDSNVYDNWYFKCFTKDVANWIMKKLILNKWYTIISCAVTCTLVLLSEALRDIDLALYMVIRSSGIFGAITLVASYYFGMNFYILGALSNSFDFWFKTWNLILWEICYCWINITTTDRHIFDIIVTMIGMASACSGLFAVDAIPVSYKIKRNGLIAFLILFSAFLIMAYFTYDDVFYNPFESYNFEHTRISLKSVYLGAYTNALLFVGKPILADTIRWIFIRCGCVCVGARNANINDMRDDDTSSSTINIKPQRMVSLYRRCKVNWHMGNQIKNRNNSQIIVNH